MALFHKIIARTRKSNKASSSQIAHEENWTCASPTEEPSVRVIMVRESDQRGRKLLFDSDTTKREPIDKALSHEDARSVYDQIHGDIGYKYVHPCKRDTKNLVEMIFGAVPLASKNASFKIHRLENQDQHMWSSYFSTSKYQKTSNSSDHSFNSSFGSNISNKSMDQDLSPFNSSVHLMQDLDRDASEHDSGVYSVPFGRDTSSVLSQINLSRPSESARDATSSAIEDFFRSYSECGSLSSVLDALPNRLSLQSNVGANSFKAVIKTPSPGPSLVTRASTKENQAASRSADYLQVRPPSRTKSRTLLGIGVIIIAPPGMSECLFEQTGYVEDIFNKIRFSAVDAYADKKSFVHIMYKAWQEAMADINDFFRAPRLVQTAFHLLGKHNVGNSDLGLVTKQFVHEFLEIQALLDTKENNFFFSTFLSTLLTHHLGWVKTMYSTETKEASHLAMDLNLDNLQTSLFLHNPIQLQYMDLHGMVGTPRRASRSVVIGDDQLLLRRFLFVMSFFLRCPILYRHDLGELSEEAFDSIEQVPIPLATGKETETDAPLQPPPRRTLLDMKKSRTAVGSLSAMDASGAGSVPKMSSSHSTGEMADPEKSSKEVVFLLGENERLIRQEQVSDRQKKSLLLASRGRADSKSVGAAGSIIITRAESIKMEPVECVETCDITDFHLKYKSNQPHVKSAMPLTSLICQSSRVIPGAVFQACCSDKERSTEDQRHRLLADLGHLARACSENSTLSVADLVFIVGDMCSGRVCSYTQQQMIRGSFFGGIGHLASPCVTNLVDSVVALSCLDPCAILEHIENKMREIVLRSHLLAAYLIETQMADLRGIVKDLDIDPNDLPLLFSVATVHSPEITQKYCLSFTKGDIANLS